LIPALLLGVAFGNLVRGVPIDAQMQYVGGFFYLLNPYALLAGLSAVVTFTLYGAVFLSLKTDGEMREKAHAIAGKLWFATVVFLLVLLITTYFETDILVKLGVDPGVIPIAGIAATLSAGFFIRKRMEGWSFVMVALGIAFTLVTFFMIMFPRVMISSILPEYSLTIENAVSSPYTLRVMTIVTVIFLPFVLAYQVWSYWVFRKRLNNESRLVY
jgi:cytochrome d ubiquinol oxidase subunit II